MPINNIKKKKENHLQLQKKEDTQKTYNNIFSEQKTKSKNESP